jgi:hypothetical protein
MRNILQISFLLLILHFLSSTRLKAEDKNIFIPKVCDATKEVFITLPPNIGAGYCTINVTSVNRQTMYWTLSTSNLKTGKISLGEIPSPDSYFDTEGKQVRYFKQKFPENNVKPNFPLNTPLKLRVAYRSSFLFGLGVGTGISSKFEIFTLKKPPQK